jgi:putative transposase
VGRAESHSRNHGQASLSVRQRKTIRHFNDPGHIHFLTFSCYRQIPFLKSDRAKQWLVEAILRAREKHQFALVAYAIMPEHAHLLIQPLTRQYDTAAILKSVKQPVARKAKRFLEEENLVWLEKLTVRRGCREVFRFWQAGPGYDRNIRDEKELLEKIQYIHNNPVKNGLAVTAEDWPWSSAGWYLGRYDGKIGIDQILIGGTDKLVLSVRSKSGGPSNTDK